MIYKKLTLGIFVVLLAGCSANKGIVTDKPTLVLKPSKQIEVEQSSLPVNLKVLVKNVADNFYSNKNYFRLYVSGKLIQPQNQINNTTKDYQYDLQLEPGFYEVKGNYYWYDGWQENQTEVKTQQLVRVDENGQTELSVDIPKSSRGIVEAKQLFFNVNYKSSSELTEIAQTDTTKPTVPAQNLLAGRKRTKLQINTDPPNCDVYIDDELIGKSPISWWVGINESHAVQVKHDNYRTGIRVVVPEEMVKEEKLIIIQRLEPLPEALKQLTQAPAVSVSLPDTVSVPDSLTSTETDSSAITTP
jgi:hypothetical protein